MGCWRVIKRERQVDWRERELRNSSSFFFLCDCVIAVVVPALHTYIYLMDISARPSYMVYGLWSMVLMNKITSFWYDETEWLGERMAFNSTRGQKR